VSTSSRTNSLGAVSVEERQLRSGEAAGYWLGRCEGFQIDDQDGRVGVVDHILHDPRSSLAQTLVVRTGLFTRRQLHISVDAVESVEPGRMRLILRGDDLAANPAANARRSKMGGATHGPDVHRG
jgi:hypothetical protein